jgi:hypothetical protein
LKTTFKEHLQRWQKGGLHVRLVSIGQFLGLYFKTGLIAAFLERKLKNLLKGFL